MRGKDAMQSKILKSVTDHFLCGLRRVTQAPVLHAQPITEFGVPMLRFQAQADAANLPPVVTECDSQPDLVRFVGESKECPCVLLGVRMRNAQRGRGYLAASDQRQQLSYIRLVVWTQPEPRGLKRRFGVHCHKARATAIPASAAPRQSRLLLKILTSIRPHWPPSKNDMVSKA